MGWADKYKSYRGQAKNDKLSAKSNQIRGKVHFVAPTAGYVAGFTVAQAQTWARENHANVYDTANLAYAACVDGRGDAIVYLPGFHTPTASIAHAKANISHWGPEAWAGYPCRRPQAIIIGPSADEAFNITGPGNAFIGLGCRPVTTKAFADIATGAYDLTIKNCYIDMHTAAVNIATAGFVVLAAGIFDHFLFEDNVAWSDGAQGPALSLIGNISSGMVRRNHFHVDTGTWASAVNLVDIDGITVEDNLASCGGTAMTAAFTGSGTTVIAGALFKGNRCGVLVTKMIDGFDTTSHAEIVENRTATIGGGTGSTLVTIIT